MAQLRIAPSRRFSALRAPVNEDSKVTRERYVTSQVGATSGADSARPRLTLAECDGRHKNKMHHFSPWRAGGGRARGDTTAQECRRACPSFRSGLRRVQKARQDGLRRVTVADMPVIVKWSDDYHSSLNGFAVNQIRRSRQCQNDSISTLQVHKTIVLTLISTRSGGSGNWQVP